ncbi:hypothetical protein LINPERPRIM_LOCUS20971 [Linum perenne]
MTDIVPSIAKNINSLTLSKEFKENLCKSWSNSVVICLLGKNIDYAYLCQRLRAIWKAVGNMNFVDLNKSCFMVKFELEQDYFKVLIGGPWILLGHYLIVHHWDHSFCGSNDLSKKMVAWVSFLFYHAEVLTTFGNLIRKMVKMIFTPNGWSKGNFIDLQSKFIFTKLSLQ